MKKVLAVREIAYFLYASGDLTSDYFLNSTAVEGKKAHKYIQNSYTKDDKKEYYIKYNLKVNEFDIEVHGFIDGVINQNDEVILEEIKSTRQKLDEIEIETHKEHLAQLKIYAYMYLELYNLTSINLRLTYIKTDTYQKKSFDMIFDIETLKEFFNKSINDYLEWLYLFEEKNKDKLTTINNVSFPFSNLREGQNDFMKATYYTLRHSDILYAIAPTGIGKTIATLFSSLKSIKNDNEKIYYLTSKGMQKEICVDNIKLLINNGLKIKSLVITSKAKSCLNDQVSCEPKKCRFAKGFFDRLKIAFKELYDGYDIYTKDVIEEVAIKYEVCPFELSLYLSNYVDIIVCDYNYIFDPKARLSQFSDDYDSSVKPKLLIDEAHNLVSRSKDMYSSLLLFSDVIVMFSLIEEYDKFLYKYVYELEDILSKLDYINDIYYNLNPIDVIIDYLFTIKSKCEDVLEDHLEFKDRDIVLDKYYKIKDFLDLIDYYNESFRFFIYKSNDNYKLKIMCLDASYYVSETLRKYAGGTVFFSATMTPINYYMNLLSKGKGKYITFKSPFDKDNLDLIIYSSINTTYNKRETTIKDIIEVVDKVILNDDGNYIVFFPSYKYLSLFLENIDVSKYNLIVQTQDMSEAEKLNILEMFKTKGHLGLFVLGGMFSEGIDFKSDLLSGVIIVSVGIPMYNAENEILKDYFNDVYEFGYEYAYTYPGFNKVVQAAGRVIRDENDRGIVILIDERYNTNKYLRLMPPHWDNYKVINNINLLEEEIKKFNK